MRQRGRRQQPTFAPAQSECSQRVLLPAFGRETRFESRWTFHRKIGQQIQERSLHDGLSRVTLGVTRHGAAPFASQGLNMYVKQTGTSELPECGRKMARLSTGSSRRLTVRTGEDVKLSVSQSVSSRSPPARSPRLKGRLRSPRSTQCTRSARATQFRGVGGWCEIGLLFLITPPARRTRRSHNTRHSGSSLSSTSLRGDELHTHR